MGFYTYLGDKLDGYKPITNKLQGEFDGKYVGGHELYQWCFKNNIKQLKIGYDENDLYDESDLVFVLNKSDIKKAIKEQVMGEVNSKTILNRLLKQMKKHNIDNIYFYGSY